MAASESQFEIADSQSHIDLTASDQQLADKLDRLSVPTAENVLQRAIELHHAEQYDDSTMSLDDLERMGMELGITPGLIRQALREELETEHEHKATWLERLIAPRRINGGLLVSADAESSARALEEFLVENEGVFEVERVGTSVTWQGSKRLGAMSSAMGPTWNSSKTLDRVEAVTTRLTEVGDGDQLLEVTVDTSKIIRDTLGGTAGFLAIGSLMGALLAGLGTNPPDFLPWFTEFFVPFFGFGLAGFGAMVMEARSTTRNVRQSVNRVMHTVRSRLRGKRESEI